MPTIAYCSEKQRRIAELVYWPTSALHLLTQSVAWQLPWGMVYGLALAAKRGY